MMFWRKVLTYIMMVCFSTYCLSKYNMLQEAIWDIDIYNIYNERRHYCYLICFWDLSEKNGFKYPLLLDGWLKAPLRIFKTPKIWLNLFFPLRTILLKSPNRRMIKAPCLGCLKAPLSLEIFYKKKMVKSP